MGTRASYPAFQRYLRLLRPAVVRDVEIRFETEPGVQTQADWAELGLFPLGEQMVELHAMVAILGCSRAPAIRFALDQTRSTSLERLAWCLHDLGGVTREVLTDRDPAFCIGQTSDGALHGTLRPPRSSRPRDSTAVAIESTPAIRLP